MPLNYLRLLVGLTSILLVLVSWPSFSAEEMSTTEIINMAKDFQAKGDTKSAEQKYIEAIRKSDRASVWIELANFYDKTNQYDKALKVTEKIRNSFPGNSAIIAKIHNNAIDKLGPEKTVGIPVIGTTKEGTEPPVVTPDPLRNSNKSQSGNKIITSDRYGCSNKDYYNKLGQFVAQGDHEAFKKALTAGIIAGLCVLFKQGEGVFLDDTAIFSGLIKIRRPGETNGYWTDIEAVK